MLNLLFEGLSSAALPCSLVLLIPGLAVLLTARQEAAIGVAGFVPAAILGSWLRLSDRVGDAPRVLIALAFVASLLLLAVPLVRRLSVVSAVGGVLSGVAASALWQPCVGEHFGSLLTDLPDRGLGSLALMTAYLVGVLAPVIAIAAIIKTIPDATLIPVRPAMLAGGSFVLIVIAGTVAANLQDDVIGRLVSWSL